MAIRDWSGRKIAALWVIGLALEGLIYLAGLIATQVSIREHPTWSDKFWNSPGNPVTLSRLISDSATWALADSLGLELTARGDTFLIRDSTGNEVVVAGDSLLSISLAPELDAVLGEWAERFAESWREQLFDVLLIAAAIFLPIPLALVIITSIWVLKVRTTRRTQIGAT
jgi:hypothetical protein